MRAFSRRVLATALMIGLVGCASAITRWYVSPTIDTTQYRTFGWDPGDRLQTGDPRLDSNPFFLERLQASVDRELGRRGFERRDTGTPDLLVHYHASVTQRIDVDDVDRRDPSAGSYEPTVYEAGTLLLDFVDARTRTLVWRGWTDSGFARVIDDQPAFERSIDRGVLRILRPFPPLGNPASRGPRH